MIALGDDRDPRHSSVRAVLASEPGYLVLPAAVAAEVDYLVRREGGQSAGRRFLADLAAGRFRVESLTGEEHGVALAVHDQYAAFDLGLADLSVMILAHRFRTHRILSFEDRRFRAVRSLSSEPFMLLPEYGG